MSNSAPLDTPGAGDDGKVQTYAEAQDRWILAHRVTQAQMDTAIADAISGLGGGGGVTDHGDLTGLADDDHPQYMTAAEVTAAITAALTSYATIVAVNTAIATALADYSTTAAVNSAISAALASYATTVALDTAVAGIEEGYQHRAGIPSGRYLHPAFTITPQSQGAGVRSWHPITVHRPQAFNQIACQVTTLGAGAVCRLGLYESTPDGFPGDLVADAGTVDCSTTGMKPATIDVDLSPGVYWACAWLTGATASLQSGAHTGGNGTFSFHQGSLDPSTVWQTGYAETGLTTDGPLPATAGALAANSTRWPIYCVLRAA